MARSIEVLEVGLIARSSSCSLHRSQILHRANEDFGAENVCLNRPGTQLVVGRNTVEPLDDVQLSELGLDRNTLPARELRGD